MHAYGSVDLVDGGAIDRNGISNDSRGRVDPRGGILEVFNFCIGGRNVV